MRIEILETLIPEVAFFLEAFPVVSLYILCLINLSIRVCVPTLILIQRCFLLTRYEGVFGIEHIVFQIGVHTSSWLWMILALSIIPSEKWRESDQTTLK
jgi:hypothetical protein